MIGLRILISLCLLLFTEYVLVFVPGGTLPKLPLPSTIRKLKLCNPIRLFPTGKLVGTGLAAGGVTACTGVGTVTGAGGREGETAESGSC